jgi:hypothetical protein
VYFYSLDCGKVGVCHEKMSNFSWAKLLPNDYICVAKEARKSSQEIATLTRGGEQNC